MLMRLLRDVTKWIISFHICNFTWFMNHRFILWKCCIKFTIQVFVQNSYNLRMLKFICTFSLSESGLMHMRMLWYAGSYFPHTHYKAIRRGHLNQADIESLSSSSSLSQWPLSFQLSFLLLSASASLPSPSSTGYYNVIRRGVIWDWLITIASSNFHLLIISISIISMTIFNWPLQCH